MKPIKVITEKCFICGEDYQVSGFKYCNKCNCNVYGSNNFNPDISIFIHYSNIIVNINRFYVFIDRNNLSGSPLLEIPIEEFDFEFSGKDDLKKLFEKISLYLAFI